jgi:hypothetical protein
MSLRELVSFGLGTLVLSMGAMSACSDDESGTNAVASTNTVSSGGGPSSSTGVGGDGGSGGTGGTCVNTLPNEMMAPANLSETGLYSDITQKTIAAYAQEFAPQFVLWSDGADKRRWIYLPECDPVIDNTDENNWSFPVGTRMWKEFSLNNGQLLETRMIHRYGPGPDDFVFAAYQWLDGDEEATFVPNGFEDAKGTEHDIPAEVDCRRCHGMSDTGGGGIPAHYLGFSAIQLSHQGPGLTMATLSENGNLMNPAPQGYTVPGNQVERAALGYLHANCSNCHNNTPEGVVYPKFDAQIKPGDSDVAMTSTYMTMVNVMTQNFMTGCNMRVHGGNLANSCIHVRMSARGSDGMPNSNQMPPLATDVVDTAGLAIIEPWILSLPPPN